MIIRILWAVMAMLAALPAMAEMTVQEVKSPGGITAWLVEEHSIPFVAFEISFRGGTSLDPDGKRGVTKLMASLLEEGAADLDARAFATRAQELGAEFYYQPDRDEISISARVLTENLEASLALLHDSLSAPRFDDTAVIRVKGQMESVIRSNQTNPQQLAVEGVSKIIYKDHPYATSDDGTLDSMAGLIHDDILAAHQAALTQERAIISVVGDITAEQLAPILDTLLGDLPENGGPTISDVELNIPGGVKVHDFETPQSVILWVQNGVERQNPDFFAAYVLNYIIGGGGFDSLLMEEVREKRGLTYGVNTSLVDHDHAVLWMGMMQSANDRAKTAIEVVQEEWQKIHKNGVTQEQLDNAKTYLTGAYPLRFDGNSRIAGILTFMQAEGLPREYIETRNSYIEAVTLDDIKRVAKQVLDPENLTFYVTGQPVGL